MAILNELTQLSKMENSKVALRARQVTPSSTIEGNFIVIPFCNSTRFRLRSLKKQKTKLGKMKYTKYIFEKEI